MTDSSQQRSAVVEQNENNVDKMVDAVFDLSDLALVGGVTELRLNQAGITSFITVAKMSIDELKDVAYHIGDKTAARIKGSAQGHLNEAQEIVEERREEAGVRPSGSVRKARIAVIAGEDELSLPNVSEYERISAALEKANVALEGNVEIGFVTNGEMGGDSVSRWIDNQAGKGELVARQPFTTPWEKYKTDDDSEDELWRAPRERTRDMVRWADKVVVVQDGQWTDQFRETAEQMGIACETAFESHQMSRAMSEAVTIDTKEQTANVDPEHVEEDPKETSIDEQERLWREHNEQSQSEKFTDGNGAGLREDIDELY